MHWQAATFKHRVERTADVRLIFSRDKKYIHPLTREALDGHWCLICQLVPGFVSLFISLTAMR
jgi:hypothetical protein